MPRITAANVLRLALELQGTAEGLSLRDIQERFTVSRRTAERMRDAVDEATSQVEEVRDHGGREKRWRLGSRGLGRLVEPDAKEIAHLKQGAVLARNHAIDELAQSLEQLHLKLKASQRPDVRLRNEVDLEAVLEAETFASRAGPRPRIDREIVNALREAIRKYRKVRISYRYRTTGKRGWDLLEPYGFIFGHRHYLIALREEADDFRSYALGNIENVEILPASFERRHGFSLTEYAQRSFGVFQERPEDVVWHFKPEAAADVREFLFHPSQQIEDRPDGSLVVRFRAGGLKEMAWHLLTWGDLVDVIAPSKLRRLWLRKSFASAKRSLRPNGKL